MMTIIIMSQQAQKASISFQRQKAAPMLRRRY